MRPLFDIQNRVVAVAGAAGAFGSVIAQELAARGCRLSLFDIDSDGLEQVTGALALPSHEIHSRTFDATIESDCKAVLDECAEKWGRIDALVNCIGVFEIVPALDMSLEVFSRVLANNVSAALSMCRFAARHMVPNGYGTIVNISSVSDSVANPGYAAYGASKSALSHLTRVLAVEWATHSITVNAISPAMSETNLTGAFLAEGTNRDNARSRILLNRLLEPEDLLGTLVLLLSPGGKFITGQTIHVDGGRTIS